MNTAGSSSYDEPAAQTNPRIFSDNSEPSLPSRPSVSSYGQPRMDNATSVSIPNSPNAGLDEGNVAVIDQNPNLDPDDPLESQEPAQPGQPNLNSGDAPRPRIVDHNLDQESSVPLVNRGIGPFQLTVLVELFKCLGVAFICFTCVLILALVLSMDHVERLEFPIPIYGGPLFMLLSSSGLLAILLLCIPGQVWPFRIVLGAILVVSVLFGAGFAASWDTENVYLWFAPQPPESCLARVSTQQSDLFTPGIYHSQFRLSSSYNETHFFRQFQGIQTNSTLCNIGFTGNADLYGLGIRTGIYLQWISSLAANNLLRSDYINLQQVYLVFSVAIAVATSFSSFIKACIFSIEIEILYWMYWGGYTCVFLSSPSSTRLGSKSIWIGINWTTAITLGLHFFMLCHGFWFWAWAYDYKFSRMPCGTYHFLFFPALDPGKAFWSIRAISSVFILYPIISQVIFAPFFLGFLLISEIKHTIQQTAAYNAVSRLIPCRGQAQEQDDSRAFPCMILSLSRFNRTLKGFYWEIRKFFKLPRERMPGIRLVTPLDVKQRRSYRIRCALTGIVACFVSIAAIETTLRWNKIQDIDSLFSIGQLVPFTMGVASFIGLIYKLFQQEMKRTRDLERRKSNNQHSEDGAELESISHTIKQALSHAFAQPDVDFLTNGGALPITEDAAGQHGTGQYTDSTAQTDNPHQMEPEPVMSGALPRPSIDDGLSN